MTEPIRVLIADDHPLFRDGLTALLTDGPDTELAGAAASGTEAVDLARETQPDVVIMDVHMPGLNGIEATRRIVADSPHIAVLVLTMFDDDDSIFSALRAGARGYLLKGADQEQIRAAIGAAANGEIIFGTQLAARMLAYFTTGASARPQVFPQLTDREREVLDLVAQGQANPAIAAKLGLSQKTVRNHVSNILTKLQVADRAQAIVQARDAGLRDIRRTAAPAGAVISGPHDDTCLMTTGHPPADAVVSAAMTGTGAARNCSGGPDHDRCDDLHLLCTRASGRRRCTR